MIFPPPVARPRGRSRSRRVGSGGPGGVQPQFGGTEQIGLSPLISPPARPRAGGIAFFLPFLARKLMPKRVMEAEGCGEMQMGSLGFLVVHLSSFFFSPLKKKKKCLAIRIKTKRCLKGFEKSPFFSVFWLQQKIAHGSIMRIFHSLTVDINIQHTVLCSRNEMVLSVNEQKPIRKP